MIITGQMIDRMMREVIAPTEETSFTIRNINQDIFPTMSNIYPKFFSQEEQLFLRSLTEADGTLKVSALEGDVVHVANQLYQRGYISKTEIEEGEEYSWRIGIWQLFLREKYQFKYRKRQGKL